MGNVSFVLIPNDGFGTIFIISLHYIFFWYIWRLKDVLERGDDDKITKTKTI